MEKNKQTAVEWLYKELAEILCDVEVNAVQAITLFDRLKQAKQMEKEQQDTFAIEFAEWYENDVLAKGDYEMITKDKKQLLEIFKETYEQQ
jgi:hypothetical protein